MNAAQKLATLILGATLLLLPAHGSVLADQIKAPVVSAGTVTTTNGSLLNVGQTTIGLSKSTTHMMHAGGIPTIISFSDPRIHGDLDGDRDVDLDDHAIFVACLNMMGKAPLRHDRSAPRHDAGDAVGCERYIPKKHTGVDRKIIDALLGLLDERLGVNLPGELFGHSTRLL